jgi:translation initiation factor 4A
LITTEAPLRAINKEYTPLAPTLLINYDIPVRKEDYIRRIATVLGGRSKAEKHRLCINFLQAGKVHELRQLEEFAEREVKEMPVHVADVFEHTANKQK